MVYHFLRVDMVKRDADHCKNPKNLFFCNELFLILLNDVLKALVALFHDNAREIIFIFDKIYDSNNHWVIKCS
jgi:hypothetical protein